MDRGPIQPRKLVYRGLLSEPYRSRALVRGISPPFGRLSPRVGQVAHVLLTRAPLYRGRSPFSCDLHVLGAPLTFALSQDQTLLRNSACPPLSQGPLCSFRADSKPFRLDMLGIISRLDFELSNRALASARGSNFDS
jgi:hypothetical protein